MDISLFKGGKFGKSVRVESEQFVTFLPKRFADKFTEAQLKHLIGKKFVFSGLKGRTQLVGFE